MNERELIACHECDLLQRSPAGSGVVNCARCGAVLFRRGANTLDRTLALALASAVLFAVAITFPLVRMEASGFSNVTTMFGAVDTLWHQGVPEIAVLVFLTTIVMPAVQLAAIVYVLLPLKWGRLPAGVPQILRLIQTVKPWAMVEVFMLGILVSVVKLGHMAHVAPGIAMWSFAGLIVSMAAMASAFHPRDIWQRIEVRR